MNNSGPFSRWNRFAGWVGACRNVARAVLLAMTLGVLVAGSAEDPKLPLPLPSDLRHVSLPLAFDRNCGQVDPVAEFLARGSGYAIFFTKKQVVMSLEWPTAGSQGPLASARFAGGIVTHKNPAKGILQLRWVGANPAPRVEGLEKETGKSNYLIGNNKAKWVRGVPAYSKVKYRGVYPGIDLVYYGNQRQLEFDIDVAPGAHPEFIQLKVSAGNHYPARLRVNRRGELVVHTRAGDVLFRKPRAYQPDGNSGNRKHFLEARYIVGKDGHVGFDISGYDPAKPLVIDPVLSYSTYLGGTDYNYATGIAVDASGNTYITGYTSSVDFPVRNGVQGVFGGGSCDTEVNTAPCFDAFISKLNPQGTGLVYSTYLGGTGDDEGVRIAVDSSGEAYVAGFTDSLDFPTAGPLQGSNGGGTCGTTAYPDPCYDAFAAKLTASGSNLVYSTYLGGTGDDFSTGIAVDSSGNAYVGGLTSASDFPVTHGSFQTSYGGGPFDGFVAKINPLGTALVYSTYLGGSQEDHVNGIALDASGDAFLAGQTNSANFPVQGAFQPRYTAGTCGSALSSFPCSEGFVTELNSVGSGLVYSSYLGGTAASYGSGIALDSSGAAYVTGWTTSKDFPVTQGAFDTTWGGTNEVFVAKIAPAGAAIDYATYLGSIYPDQANAIAVDSSGDAYIAGYAYDGKFPISSPLQAVSGGLYDAIVSEFDATGSTLVFSTYLGGAGDEAANDLALDSYGNVYVAGDTFSTDFPITPSAMTTGYTGGSYDAWITRISPQNAAGLTAVPNPVVFARQEISTTSAPSILKVGDAGSAALDISEIAVSGDFAATSQCGQTVSPGTQCAISVTFTPTATGTRTGTLVLTDNAAGSPQTVKLSGYGTSGVASLSATSLDFGSVVIGTTSTQTVTLTDAAQSPLDISSIQAGGDYSESNTCGSVVNPGSSCTIAVSFSPSALGTSVGTVTVTDTALDSPQAITLTGTGVTPFSLTADPSSATVLVGTDHVQFTVLASTSDGFTGSIDLGCANIAPATCTFSPGSITPGQSSTLTVGNLSAITSPSLSFAVTGTVSMTSSGSTSALSTTSSGTMTATLPLSVQFADFSLAVTPADASIQAGQAANYTLTLTPLNGFDVPVSLVCDGAPAGSSCSFASSTLQVSSSGPVQDTLTVSTTSRSLVIPAPEARRFPGDGSRIRWFVIWLWCMSLGLMFVPVRKRDLRGAAIRNVVATILLGLAMVACGGGSGGGALPGQNSGTPARTYTLKVTATAQSLSHTTQVTLKVN